MRGTIRFGFLLFSYLLFGPFAASFAATDGAVGATSTGTVNISLFVPAQVRLTGLDEVRIDTSQTDRVAMGLTHGCVFRTPNADFQIRGFGGGEQHSFTLTDGSSSRDYEATIIDGQRRRSIADGIAVHGRHSADQLSAACGGVGSDLALGVALPGLPLDAGTYTGTLTLVVSPN